MYGGECVVKMKRGVFCGLLLVVILTINVFAAEKMLSYEETTGDKTIVSKWVVKSSADSYEVIAKSPGEYHRVVCTRDYSTNSWEYQQEEAGTDLRARWEKDLLIIRGMHNKKVVQKEIELHQLPWFQFVEFSLADFIQSDKDKTEFWIIQPYNLKHYKMVAIKERTEMIVVADQEVEAIRVKVTLPGIASIFWSARYWYRKSDGVYLRYEGVRGGPGTPKTVVELINE